MSGGEFLSKLKRSKIDLTLLIIALILILSNQILTTQLLRGSGTIIVTDGAAIPQESNYTISTEFSPSVTTAVLFNYTLDEFSGVSFDVITENVSRLSFNITLQSTQNNTDVNVLVQLGGTALGYNERFDIVVGTNPTIVSLEPNMTSVHSNPDKWIQPCRVLFTTDVPLEFKSVLLWAEFDIPVSPVILNWQTTDGDSLFENPYSMWMGYFHPEIRIEHQSGEDPRDFRVHNQNRTLYLKPMNYSMEVSWGGEFPSIPIFNFTVSENYSSICTLQMKTVKLSLSKQNNIPLIHLKISTGLYVNSFYSQYSIYDLYLHDSEFPEYLFLPPANDGYLIHIYSIDPLSRTVGSESSDIDVHVYVYVHANGSHHQNVEIQMSYWYFFGYIVTPRDFVQFSLGMILFSLAIIRIIIYFSKKIPKGSWRTPHLIPAILLGLTTFIPWIYSIREMDAISYFYGFDTTITVAALGPFPLIASWTDSGLIFLDIPRNGIYWAILSLFLFWLPLLYSIYALTPHRNNEVESSLILFLPILFMFTVPMEFGDFYSFPFYPNLLVVFLLIIIPIVTFSYHIVMKLRS